MLSEIPVIFISECDFYLSIIKKQQSSSYNPLSTYVMKNTNCVADKFVKIGVFQAKVSRRNDAFDDPEAPVGTYELRPYGGEQVKQPQQS